MLNGYTKIIIAVFLFSLGPLFVKVIDLDAISILWSANLIGLIVISLKIIAQKRTKTILTLKNHFLIILSLGIFVTVNNSLFNLSIKTTTIANAVLTHYLAPIFVLILSIAVLKEKLKLKSILAIILSLIGLGIMLSPNEFTFSNAHFLGLILGTSSALFFAFEIMTKKIISKYYRSDIMVFGFLSMLIILLIPFISIDKILSLDIIALLSLLVLGALVIGVGNVLFISGLRQVKAHKAGIISYIEPLGAIFWGFVIIAELPLIQTFIGGFLILAGTYIIIKK